VAEQVELPPHARAVLTGPDLVARSVARAERDPQKRWMLRRPRAVRRDYLEQVIDGGADQERWMLLQDDDTRTSYVEDVLEVVAEPDRRAIWLLLQPRKVRQSYVDEVIGA
jgi:hypothetical protein